MDIWTWQKKFETLRSTYFDCGKRVDPFVIKISTDQKFFSCWSNDGQPKSMRWDTFFVKAFWFKCHGTWNF